MAKKRSRRRTQKSRGAKRAGAYERAVQLYEAGELLRAEQTLRDLVKAGPNQVEARVLLARVYAHLDAYDQADEQLQKAIELEPANAQLRLNLGEVLYQAGRELDAVVALETAHRLDPEGLRALDGLASILFKHAKSQRSVALWTRARSYLEKYCALSPTNVPKRWLLADCYEREGATDKRIQTLREIHSIAPDDPSARHLLAALDQPAEVDTTDINYVRDVFDAAAEHFDKSLVDTLQYQVPQQIKRSIDALLEEGQGLDRVLDLGCGTGLVAEAIGARCGALTGVDVSSQMVEQARRKGVYEQLYVATLEDYLDTVSTPYDAIIAADVLMYVGDLQGIFKKVSQKLTEGGLFIFSIELLAEPGFTLQSSGRFAHSDAYVRQLVSDFGFSQLQGQEMTIRMEGTSPLMGALYVLSHPGGLGPQV